ncbi:MAG: hypothetical protein AAGD13_02815 [Pseudomonadota bacterium]
MKLFGKTMLSAVAVSAVIATAQANEFEPALRELAEQRIMQVANDPAIVAAIQARNTETQGMPEDQIIALDKKWRAEVGSGDTPTITPVLEGPVADMLRAVRDESEGLFTEIFVMDMVGLNVAASDTTSDFWQGDEAKWQQTYGVGAGAVHISEVELDESTQSYQSQISVVVSDPSSGSPIGAATFGVNVEFLE